MPKPEGAERFAGFHTPRYTQIPDQFFDDLLAYLSGAETKVLLYLMRKTFGWKKDTDDIGLMQIATGQFTRDGKRMDWGTGLSKASVASAAKSLEEWGLIERTQNTDAQKGDLPTTYRVRLLDTPVSKNWTPPLPKIGHPRVQKLDTQNTPPSNTPLETNGVTPDHASAGTPDRALVPVPAPDLDTPRAPNPADPKSRHDDDDLNSARWRATRLRYELSDRDLEQLATEARRARKVADIDLSIHAIVSQQLAIRQRRRMGRP